ncbi:Thioredoxin H2-1 [Tetrabaena socialis]|uniref:Thioredoxin H2-1 n=1 Tax=Tetrabaena socialis TaxID=47790 RepID=A0A2J8AEF7_9CHLO|nr:Thioredoxin H2-1 [Tetrabaena socialis]|eukprot:PNH10892.1 Thioredoxin H2-1 [Tetrabaena socialis]
MLTMQQKCCCRAPGRPAVLALRRARVSVRTVADARPSIDPMANKPRPAAASPGTVYSAITPAEVEATIQANKERLVVVMCKSSHCKPCKRFMPKYSRMAELLSDSVLLDVVGDRNVDTKKMMMDWGVKSTPTFRMYRGGELVGTSTGAKEAKILPVLLPLLLEGEAGKGMQAEDLEEDTSTDED